MEDEQVQQELWKEATQNSIPTAQHKTEERNLAPSQGPAYPNTSQVEKLRLILSTYQDGTGQLSAPDGMTSPGWRDFERAAAATFDGQAQESKHVFDVIVSSKTENYVYGISCKMRGELTKSVDRVNRKGQQLKGRISMELSNSAKYFWTYLKARGIDESNYRKKPEETGIALVELVKSWHDVVSLERGGKIDISKSFYLVLSWDRKGSYQLHQFALDLPDPKLYGGTSQRKPVKREKKYLLYAFPAMMSLVPFLNGMVMQADNSNTTL